MLKKLPTTTALAFNNPEHFRQFRLIHDTVMGGRSAGQVDFTEDRQGLVFSGNLSLENNGGFASAEFTLASPLAVTTLSSLYIDALGDGRSYQIRLKTPYIPNGVAYVATFDTVTERDHYYVPLSAFYGQFRGRRVSNLPKLKLTDVNQLSIMLADKQPGPFSIVLYSVSFASLDTI
ncbi:CIA30 family protein [Alishewanella tabrizica]|nr:CIA30 family protein [Alishewanella tabrizica]